MKGILKIAAVALAGVAVTLTGLFVGYGIFDKISTLKVDTLNPVVVKAEKPLTLREGATVKYIYTYEGDGEKLTFEEKAPSIMVGQDLEKIREILKGYEIRSLTENNLVVSKTLEGISNTNYLIGTKEGYVAVYFENGILKEKTATPVDSLDISTRAEIERGIKIQGSEELACFLEDIES